MIFNQFEFLFIFLPLVLAAFFAPRCQAFRPYMLVAASLIFYGLSGVEHAIVLAAGILWVYFCARTEKIVQNRAWLIATIVPPVGALFYYTYLGFFVREDIGLK
ncbi:MAG: hypothetical protein O3A85_11960, partial [Proteobacteria bacterium]|nr:hypothetical protein [Pseudomonadota bacterium]